ncbi:DUF1616 domain-containing protein [Halorubrum sp. Hd13]|uniref:DUF1616 domain-containing protein n=1 Tax=Halorubrum sp. Hd13 TaxID=1480728 RepID=UPI000B992A80|nr:DUF1616 domain-containing protein [Halorubrum sp. Hd13]OYR46158.1 hypothetical protein DJ81_03630 [Halorubrum sp. Hd13]
MNGTPSGRVLSWDVLAVLGYAAAVAPLQWIGLPPSVRIALLTPLLLFLPGYALSTVLFPKRPAEGGSRVNSGFGRLGGRGSTADDSGSRIDMIERTALGVGLSLGLLPLFAFAFDLVLGRVVGPIIVVSAVFSALMALIGGFRRSRLPESDRFEVPIWRWYDDLTAAVVDEQPRVAVVNVALAVSVVLALGAVGVAFAVPQEGATFTEFAVGSEEGGEFVTDEYPDGLAVGETAEPALLIENREREVVEYHVVARFERVEDGAVVAAEEAGGFSVTVEPGETVVETHRVTPPMTGEDVRLRFLLYREEPQTSLGTEPAYRSVHVWIDVE